MFENIAAFDIGTTSIKVITAKTGLRNFQIKNLLFEDIRDQVSGDTNEKIPLSDIIRKIIEENDLHDHKILTNLPMQKNIIRNFTFPFKDREKISEAIPYEAEELLPFELSDTILDFEFIKSSDNDSANILFAAASRSVVGGHLALFDDINSKPVFLGLEAQSLFESWRYFNRIQEEAVMLLDIGSEKTILNFVFDNNLLFTRSVAFGTGVLYNEISRSVKIPANDAARLFEDYRMDINLFDNNIYKDISKELSINKNTLKKIFEKANELIDQFVEQLIITRKSFLNEYPEITLSRIIFSGGGSNIAGLGTLISAEFEMPVVDIPFLEEYKEPGVRSRFSIALGTLLSYLNKSYTPVSFLQEEFQIEKTGSVFRHFYLPVLFLILTMIVVFVNLGVSSYLGSASKHEYNVKLNERFKKYFRADPGEDPVADARKLLKEEKKKLEAVEDLVQTDEKVLDMLKEILSFFPRDESFELKNIVINESVIRIDGNIGSSKNLDDFKIKLNGTKKYDADQSTNMRGNVIGFNMTIKLKSSEKPGNK